jgi:threonine aldolase
MNLINHQNSIVDLRSDTVTKPSSHMRRAMCEAEVGDDCYGEDPSVATLETYVAKLLGKESALFTSTGTLSNQIAIRAQTRPGDEVITESRYHVSFFEASQSAQLCNVSLNTVKTRQGVLTAQAIQAAIESRPRGRMYAQAKLVTIENSISAVGGKIFPLKDLQQTSDYCRSEGLSLHLDGARLFNASAATGINPAEYVKFCDTVSICFAKALGAPFGAALAGSKEFVEEARRIRKLFGAGLHQAGMLAAGAHYALIHNREQLLKDHLHAALLAKLLINGGEIQLEFKPETNMVYFKVPPQFDSASDFVARCQKRGVLLFPWNQRVVRAVTHLGISREMIINAAKIIGEIANESHKRAPTLSNLVALSSDTIQ